MSILENLILQQMNNIKYYIVGPRNNWKISRSTFIVLGLLFFAIFFSLIIFPTYQYLTSDYTIRVLEENLAVGKSTTQKLENNLGTLQKRIATLQKELDEKTISLENLQTNQKTDTQAQLASQEKVLKYQLEIKNLLSALKNKNAQLATLKGKQKKQNQQIQSLSTQLRNLETKFHKNASANASTSFQKTVQALSLEQFQTNLQQDNISVRFNLRNTGNTIQAGYISTIPLLPEQLDKKILFNSKHTISFSIKQFRSFSQEFKVPNNRTYSAIRVIVWNKNKNELLNQNFLIQ